MNNNTNANNNNNNNTPTAVENATPHITPERHAPHLSEFYPIMNSNNNANNTLLPGQMMTSPQRSEITPNTSKFLSSRNSMRRPSSVASNSQSIMSDLQTLITRHDVNQTKEAMQSLHETANEFQHALSLVASCSSKMASEFENFAKLKGCNDDTAEKFMNASGLFHLLGNHELIMSQFVNNLLIESIKDMSDEFQFKSKSLENNFNSKRKEESLKLKIQEKFNNDFSRRNVRNLISYRESLNNLQNQLDQLELLKYDYYNDSYQLVESTCNKVLKNVASITRAQVEISENIARKGWSGGGLDDLLIDADDPFTKNEEEEEEEEEHEDVEVDNDSRTDIETDIRSNDQIMNSIPEENPSTASIANNHRSNQNVDKDIDHVTNSIEQISLENPNKNIKTNSTNASNSENLMDNNNNNNNNNNNSKRRSKIGIGNETCNDSHDSTNDIQINEQSDEDDDNNEENDNSFALPASNSVGIRTSSIIEEDSASDI
ncbi:hypothetical protein C6P45_004266 [Maudiozyma exigua]|uniref:IMD domain-containing protein n=1 Tax=Maudiozyma exigua TaxID=34358 RepID=A0A9P6WC36_MAUEX|nr:hypothetical protein C6P45_004266 [Kazachstania exigua]